MCAYICDRGERESRWGVGGGCRVHAYCTCVLCVRESIFFCTNSPAVLGSMDHVGVP